MAPTQILPSHAWAYMFLPNPYFQSHLWPTVDDQLQNLKGVWLSINSGYRDKQKLKGDINNYKFLILSNL